MLTAPKTHGWAGTLPFLVSTAQKAIRARLDAFVPDAGEDLQRAWDNEFSVTVSLWNRA